MACRCEGLDGIELIVCLSPPPGEHELDIRVGGNFHVVINEEGVFTSSIAVEETLPFARSVRRRVDPSFLERVNLGVEMSELLCMAVRSLLESARGGSARAARKVEECADLIENILRMCGEGVSP